MEANDGMALTRFVPSDRCLVTEEMFGGGLEQGMGFGDGGVHGSVTSRCQALDN